MKYIVSGGGTGGHIYPAIAIAKAIKMIDKDAEFLFIGALDKMEMQKVPLEGFNIVGLPISGVQRGFDLKSILRNLSLGYKIPWSFWLSLQYILNFQPHAMIGTGGYASGIALFVGQLFKIPTYIQEQNAYPGFTNKILGIMARKIFLSYPDDAAKFSVEKSIVTGNAIREDFENLMEDSDKAKAFFGLNPSRKIVFVTGGSLGAKAINHAISVNLDKLKEKNIQLIWQVGSSYYPKYESLGDDSIKVYDFIPNIQSAYAAADLIVSRAGGAIFELSVVGKPLILMPSPHVAEDHQTKNARSLEKIGGCKVVLDSESEEKLVATILDLLDDQATQDAIAKALKSIAKPKAASLIAFHILNNLKPNHYESKSS
ncbi:MAG: undecaprenyldiphospho-muramoylpentapeptide beta-N-acetylglucosaminyltransferase [Chitinophagales bacterium]|jgi:UDP-N-acetylglucosamine--N-acetylmuramyl-(pentapeptide) pyrophosphoryl-undecaprenol N-acetylglucosamine transferase|nr:undecaprenyldiphospho-muramoylpentapeptide beta-N-acetylglucosaminyltransferase [Chitinophagales bacterium]